MTNPQTSKVIDISSRFPRTAKELTPPTTTAAFVWGRWIEPGDVVGFAFEKCTRCAGFGYYLGLLDFPNSRAKGRVVCPCALRGAFTDAYSEYSRIKSQVASGMVSKGAWTGPLTWSRPKEEFVADFELVAKRILAGQPMMQRIFKLHVVEGHDWRVCCRIMGVERGPFYHEVYRMQARLGFAFLTTAPYPLAPAADYFRKLTTCERNEARITETKEAVEREKKIRAEARAATRKQRSADYYQQKKRYA